jgi:hypothetical protein
MNSEHIEWSRKLFWALNDNGIWAVPRSGLVFQKRGGSFYLIRRYPWDSSFSFPKEKMLSYQLSDFNEISRHMVAAGVPVEDETGLVGRGSGDPPN